MTINMCIVCIWYSLQIKLSSLFLNPEVNNHSLTNPDVIEAEKGGGGGLYLK